MVDDTLLGADMDTEMERNDDTTSQETQDDTSSQSSEPKSDTSWLDNLPDEIKESKSFKKFLADDPIETLQKVFKSYSELEGVIGKKKIPVPENEQDEKAWNEVFKALGLPDSQDEYNIDIDLKSLGVADYLGEEANAIVDKFKEIAWENKLPPWQAKRVLEGLLRFEADLMKEEQKAFEEQRTEAEKQLRQEWGNMFEQELAKANKAFEMLTGGDE